MDWLLLQLADSAFPVGGFAHSGGLEAAWQAGEVRGAAGLRRFARQALWQAGHGALPLCGAAHREPGTLAELDALCDAFLASEVANRASRAQGRALLGATARSFPRAGIEALRARAQGLRQHHAPLFGALAAALGLRREQAQGLYLLQALRGVLSAGVRLGLVGPHEAQQLQHEATAELDRVLARCGELPPGELAQAAPLVDLFQGAHDRLYSRLFQS